MRLSTRGRYGLRAIIDLALNSADGSSAASLQSISYRQGISEHYLEQLMRLLKNKGLVTSVRGARGGYRLAKDPGEISVGAVLRALEGSIKPVACGGEKDCAGFSSCVTKYVWQKMNDAVEDAVDSITLDVLIDESRRIGKAAGAHKQICEPRQN